MIGLTPEEAARDLDGYEIRIEENRAERTDLSPDTALVTACRIEGKTATLIVSGFKTRVSDDE